MKTERYKRIKCHYCKKSHVADLKEQGKIGEKLKKTLKKQRKIVKEMVNQTRKQHIILKKTFKEMKKNG